MKLTTKQKIYLKGKAHDLEPLSFVGKNGISDSFIASLSKTLDDHELIKMKFQAFKEERKEMTLEIVQKVEAILIGEVGNIAILYRQNQDPEKQKIKIPKKI